MRALDFFTRTAPAPRTARTTEIAPRAADLIGRASAEKRPVALRIDGAAYRYKSLFVQSDAGEGLFHIDMLFPRSAARLLLPHESRVRFSFEENGVKYSFLSLYLGTGASGGFDSMLFAFPETIEESQRRGDYRVQPRMSEPVKVVTGPDLSETAPALDVSAGGVSFRAGKQVRSGDRFETIIALPGGGVVEAALEVLYCDPLPEAREMPWRIRARFAKIAPGDRETLIRYVMSRQREIIRTSLS
ncbi:MAG: PilZ domain-containing protein [Nitrospinae bacterium]|nr:PilZ domain-containing protein [Nitrospinota bacterium]